METTCNREVTHLRTPEEQLHVRAADLHAAFNQYADTIQILSLDCFDTLLWRKTTTPKDVFFDLQQRPPFKSLGIAAINRIDAESSSRRLTFVRHGHYEVTLFDIYRTWFKSLTDAEVNALIEEEMSTEIATCYAFPAVVDLIRTAHVRGLKIIIVSNTYFQQPQLLRLLQSTLPNDIFAMIDSVFCSCDYKQSKNNTLFDQVLIKLAAPANAILHVGDDQAADFHAPRKRGMHALHLIPFDKKLIDYFRLQSTAATIADADIHRSCSLLSPFRGILSSTKLPIQQPESLIGYLSMGPIMYTFARYLCEEIQALKLAGKRPKVLFLLRDAFLPFLACEALSGSPIGVLARISRFCAIAASFRNEQTIAEFITGNSKPENLEATCRQLLLPPAMAAVLLKQARASADPSFVFCQLILDKKIIDFIISQSKNYFSRLKKYLQKLIQLEPGDTLVFVDLGYLGRTQSALTPILNDEMGIEVTGRYLISLNSPEWQHSRRGLIDPSWCDDRTVQLLSIGNTLLEELTCSPDNSVDNYDEEGNPLFTGSAATKTQREKTAAIQAECIRFIHDAKHFFNGQESTWPVTMLRGTVLAELARKTFLPLSEEIEYLQDYMHDENFGTNLASASFSSPDVVLASLRRHGLWFKNQGPYGLRFSGFELALTLSSQYRHGFEVTLDDLSLRRENVLVITSQNQHIIKQNMSASHTYDGYFSLWFALQNQDTQIAILFGLNYEALQIECVELIPANYFYSKEEKLYSQDIQSTIILNQMVNKKADFFECSADTASLMVNLKANPAHKHKQIFRLVFRPIIRKTNSVDTR